MKCKLLIPIGLLLFLFSCQKAHKESYNLELSENILNVDFQHFSLTGGRPGIELLIGKDETALSWFPETPTSLQRKERLTPKGKAMDISMTWRHPDGYDLTWSVCQLNDLPGFTLRSSFTNKSKESLRLKNFVLCKTSQDGLVCQGNPASWWLMPVMNFSRQAGNLAQVLPSKKRLKEQKVYGYDSISDNDPRNDDGHWRFFEEALTLYTEMDRSGITMGAVGPAVSYIQFNCRVDNNKILMEILSRMDEILVEPGETRESEEVLILAQPYREALINLFSWMAETHKARKNSDPIFGWCSWYSRFNNIDEGYILSLTQAVKEQREKIPLKVIQLDDGWSGKFGDWNANKKFPQGMKFYADKIREAGAIPGIWMAPLYCLVEKPNDWFQNGKGSFLDPTHPESEKFIISSITKLKDAGYRYFKFDYNTIVDYRPNDPKMTKFEIMRYLFSLYRQTIGEESYMLACGAPSRPVVGLADASRIGFDGLARWKSYPLADDSLPTLPTDVFDAVFTTALSSMMNNRLYVNDPDVTYMLPRAEDHIWQGPKGSFDSVKNGLNWTGLQTFHSYIGLLGGTAMVSEPLNTTKYQQHNSLRMLEILNPPAPDKGWSMNGDIDPWGRQFGFIAARPWGNFASIALWNKEDTASDIRLDAHTLQTIGKQFHVWSFWDEKYLGIGDSLFVVKNVTEHGCSLLRLTQIPSQNDLPVVVGSNFHISMGSAELESVESAPDEMRIRLTDAGARDGKIYIYSLIPLRVKSATGCEVFVVPQGGNVYAIVITNRLRTEKNMVLVSKEDNLKSRDEILKNPDLLQKFINSSFDFDKMK